MEEKRFRRGIFVYRRKMTPAAKKVRPQPEGCDHASRIVSDPPFSQTGHPRNAERIHDGGLRRGRLDRQHYKTLPGAKARDHDTRGEAGTAPEIVGSHGLIVDPRRLTFFDCAQPFTRNSAAENTTGRPGSSILRSASGSGDEDYSRE
jgi:hypothetical protein